MSRFLLDTNSLADCIFRRRGVDQRVTEHRQRGDTIGTSIPVAAEILGGAEYSATRERNLKTVRRNLNLFVLWPFDLNAAVRYGAIYADLKRRGIKIQSIDIMTAAIALNLGCRVVTTDGDFSQVPSLNIEDWTK
jgi:predicted nucleic acid-binding protein